MRDSPDAVLVGDTQSTLLLERLAFREDNRAARARLFGELARIDTKTLIFLGDLVARPSTASWRPLDVCFAELRARTPDLRIAAAVGNHDLWLCPARGYADLAARGLVGARETWQRVDVRDVCFLLLDSNRRALGAPRWDAQTRWLDAAISHAEADETVRAIVVVSHHPPWTNSAVTSDHAPRLAPLLRLFHGSSKTRVWLSGHVHAYERFDMAGKTLVVSGSGGAPRVALRSGARARHAELARVSAPSPFGWLELHAGEREATLTLRGFMVNEPMRTFDVVTF